MTPPTTLHWLFWDVDPAGLRVVEHADYILGRVLERGRIADVRWVIETYGVARIRDFFRERPRPELTPRTVAFWRAFFREEQTWPQSPSWRPISSAPWHG